MCVPAPGQKSEQPTAREENDQKQQCAKIHMPKLADAAKQVFQSDHRL